ncbi:hypothetical protein EV189_4028 [Motilibacter rhizosphaerae]|uniref:Uncharacterized protein n=1 Tax=Motilibacter rhizosphaerae TaxID=598652 RepID=A0A4Q7N743_9ACTN|nr:hypothetical protein [Motilibacter rhizosphaerae]RZS77520.1 hypothetical protein EV189_4028 [Motilibacter rhizosphaerae]
MSKRYTVRVLDQDFGCPACRGATFRLRMIKLNTSGAELFDLGWANKESAGLICERCGHIAEFVVTDALSLYQL